MKEKVTFIINPISGSASKAELPALINQLIDKNKYEHKIVFTDYRGQATEIALEATLAETSVIVAVGGDGTVNEIGKALINTQSALAIIPAGSGNGLARHMKIPLNISKALQLINQGKRQKIDAGLLNGHVFFCTSGVGFDAHVGSLFAKKIHRGLGGYITTTIREFFDYKPETYSLCIQGKEIKIDAFLITFANASQYGNNAYIAPHAKIEDQLIDICILRKFPAYAAIGLGLKLFTRKIDTSIFFDSMQDSEFTLKRYKEGMVHLDGEPMLMEKDLNVRVLPSCLNLIAP